MGKGLRVVMSAVGLEPTANQLKVDCSTTELRGHFGDRYRERFLSLAMPTRLTGYTPIALDRCYCSAFRGAMQ